MNRSVYNLEVSVALDGFGTERQTFYCSKECIVDFLADNLDELGIAVEFDFAYTLDFVDVVNDVDIVGGDDLRSVSPICLISVIFLGIVGGSDVDTALAA